MIYYIIGITLAAFLYRESVSLMSRGLKVSTLGLIRSD